MTKSITSCRVQKMTALIGMSLLVWLLGLAGCSTLVGAGAAANYNRHPLTVAIPLNLSPEDVERIMVLTLRQREWTVVQQSPQEVVGKLDHRQFQAETTFQVDAHTIRILSDSYFKSPDSSALEPGVPKGWLRNLQADLHTRLTRQSAQK